MENELTLNSPGAHLGDGIAQHNAGNVEHLPKVAHLLLKDIQMLICSFLLKK